MLQKRKIIGNCFILSDLLIAKAERWHRRLGGGGVGGVNHTQHMCTILTAQIYLLMANNFEEMQHDT